MIRIRSESLRSWKKRRQNLFARLIIRARYRFVPLLSSLLDREHNRSSQIRKEGRQRNLYSTWSEEVGRDLDPDLLFPNSKEDFSAFRTTRTVSPPRPQKQLTATAKSVLLHGEVDDATSSSEG